MDNKPENRIEVSVVNSPLSKKEQIFWERFLLIFGLSVFTISFLAALAVIIYFGFIA